jgi:predicted NBD/HSP70 family sugar kinase
MPLLARTMTDFCRLKHKFGVLLRGMHYEIGDVDPVRVKVRAILIAVYEGGAMSRHELVERTGIQQSTLNRAVAALIDRDLLITSDSGPSRTGRGRPSDLLRINPAAGYVVGLEFGREHLTLTAVDATAQIVHTVEDATPPAFAPEYASIDALLAAVDRFVDEASIEAEKVRAVGVALHDIVTAEGQWLTQASASGPLDVRTYLEGRLGLPVVVDDVSRAFAEAEHRFGAGVGEPDMIYVFIGSHGVGGGIFVNDGLLQSSKGICGEIGHVVIDEDGRLCQCGSRGCLETVATRRAVEARFDELLERGVWSRLSPGASFGDICRAAGEGDKGAYLVLNQLAQHMGRALAPGINLSGAPTVIIGGPVNLAGEAFLQDLSAALRQRVVSGLVPHIKVRYARLSSHAGAWGVAIRALEDAMRHGHFEAPEPQERTRARGTSMRRSTAPSSGSRVT